MLRSTTSAALVLALSALTLISCAGSDAGPDADAGSDAGQPGDSGSPADGGTSSDSGTPADGGDAADAGDGGSIADAHDAGPGFAGGFSFAGGAGGFGGGACTATRTPVVFFHGNGDDASVWSRASSTGGPSVLAALKAAGYRDCELFGLTWLTSAEKLAPELVYHDAARAKLVRSFLDAVRAWTGQHQVDIVGHSMGATLALHALEDATEQATLRRFVSISGGLRGLQSCVVVGPANPSAPTCGSQNLFDSNTFGFYPSSNARMEAGGFRDRPANPGGRYYSIRAGSSDEVLCATSAAGCDSALFDTSADVVAQLNVGQGTPTVALGDDDSTGVGHFRARSNAGPLLVNFLTTTCTGSACCAGVSGHCAP